VSEARHGGQEQAPAGARAQVTAHFTLEAERGQDVAGAAAELIRRLQEMANLPGCAYELDVDVRWPDASALAEWGEDAPPAGSQSDSR
jgi:hypothetical protein